MKQALIIILIFVSGGSRSIPADNDPLPAESREVVCFVYHRINDHRYPSTNTSAKDFESHLSYLAKHHFKVLTFSQAIDYLKSGKPAGKTAVITIDDGYKSFYKNGLPLLKKFNMPATLFVNTKTIGDGGDMMSWQEISDAMKNNIEIGNHTHTHKFFLNDDPRVRYKIFKDEIELSQSIFEEKLKTRPSVFTFPYGEFDPEMKKIVKESGFAAAAAQNSGVLHEGSDLFMCPRFPMSEAYSAPEKFAGKAMMKALVVHKLSPESFVATDKRPLLTMTISSSGIRTDQLRCFVQGNDCELKVIEKSADTMTITVQAKKNLTGRRRTLYTVTAPDKESTWHWYSHVWINATVKGE